MKKHQVSKLTLTRETIAELENRSLAEARQIAAAGTVRSACGSCPPLSCLHSRCCTW